MTDINDIIHILDKIKSFKCPKCAHNSFTFYGVASMVGDYFCDKCKFKMTPKEYNEKVGIRYE